MMAELRASQIVALVAIAVTSVVAAVVALGEHSADTQFVQDQRHPPRVQPAEVERVVASAPDPSTGKGRGADARCAPHGGGSLRNPWTCVVHYASGKTARLSVRISSDGFYEGQYAGGGGATGCCVRLPGVQQ